MGKSTAASFGAPFELQTTGRVHLLVRERGRNRVRERQRGEVTFISLQAARSDSDRDKWINAIKSKLVADAKSVPTHTHTHTHTCSQMFFL